MCRGTLTLWGIVAASAASAIGCSGQGADESPQGAEEPTTALAQHAPLSITTADGTTLTRRQKILTDASGTNTRPPEFYARSASRNADAPLPSREELSEALRAVTVVGDYEYETGPSSVDSEAVACSPT